MKRPTNPSKAIRLVNQYNRERVELERMRERLERKQEKLRATYSAMFAALPDDYGIVLTRDSGDPMYVTDPNGQKVCER